MMSNPTKPNPRQSYGTLLFVSALVLLAFILRIHQLGEQSLWYDELLELDIVQGPLSAIGPQLPRHAAMPLDYYLMYGWVRLGRQDFWVRWPALLFGVLAIPLTFALARRLFNQRVAYIATLLMTVALFAVRYSRETRPYALLLCFTLITFLGLWQVYRTHKMRYWLMTIVGLSGAALSHYFTLFLLAPMGLFVAGHQLLHLRQPRFWRHTACFALAILVLALIFGLNGRILVLYRLSYRFSSVVIQPETLTLPADEKPNRGSGPPLESRFFIENMLTPLTATSPSGLVFYNAFFLVGLLLLAYQGQPYRRAMLLLCGWLLLPIFLIYTFLLYRGTFFATRYILYTLPAYLIIVAYGLDRLAGWLVKPGGWFSYRQFTSMGVPVLLVIPALIAQSGDLYTYYTAESREDWWAVGQLLSNYAGPDDVVIAVKAEPPINWYYPPASAPFGTYGRTEPILAAMQQHPRRWFVLSSYSFKRDEKLREWLAPQSVRIVIDRRIVVYLQQEGKSAQDLLAEVKQFNLPQKSLTYAHLADQFKQTGDVETSRAFYRQAIALASSAGQKARYEALLAALPDLDDTIIIE